MNCLHKSFLKKGAWGLAGCHVKNLPSIGAKIAVVGVSILLVACNAKGKIDPLAGGGGLKGKWTSSDGVFSADLVDGILVSRANDTGEVLAEGTYLVKSADKVELRWSGKLSGGQNTANCQRNKATVLQCTDQNGRTFTLNKVGST